MFRVNICVTRRKISYSDSNQHVGPSEDCLTSCLRLSTPSWLVPTEDINLYKHVTHLYFKVHQNAAHCSFYHTNRRKWFICAGLLSAAEESRFGALVCVCVCSLIWGLNRVKVPLIETRSACRCETDLCSSPSSWSSYGVISNKSHNLATSFSVCSSESVFDWQVWMLFTEAGRRGGLWENYNR